MVSFGKFYAKIVREFQDKKQNLLQKYEILKEIMRFGKKSFEIYSNWGFFDNFIPEKLIFLLKLEPFKGLLP